MVQPFREYPVFASTESLDRAPTWAHAAHSQLTPVSPWWKQALLHCRPGGEIPIRSR
jgi:hypothetical protein